MKRPKDPLKLTATERTTGFIVVDASDPSALKPLYLAGAGLFVLANKANPASIFRIEPRKPKNPRPISDRAYSYRYAWKQLQKIIDRHYHRLRQMQASETSKNWARTKNAAMLKLKIKPLRSL